MWGKLTAGDYKRMKNKSGGKVQYQESFNSQVAGNLLRSDKYVGLG